MNKTNMIYLLTALAVIGIITSSISLSIIYVGEATTRISKGLSYHLSLIVSSFTEAAPWTIYGNVSDVLASDPFTKHMALYFEYYSPPEGGGLTIIFQNRTRPPANLTLENPVVLVYIPHLKNNYLLMPKPPRELYELKNLSGIYSVVIEIGGNTSIGTAYFITYSDNPAWMHKYYEKFLGDLNQAFHEDMGVPPSTGGNRIQFIHAGIGTTTTPLEGIIWRMTSAVFGTPLAVITGSLGVYRDVRSLLLKSYHHAEATVNAREPSTTGMMVHSIYGSVFIIALLRMKIQDIVYTYSVQGSLTKLYQVSNQLLSSIRLRNYLTGILEYPLYDAVNSIGSMEFIVRLSVILSLLPALVIVWITASYIPPAVIMMMRKQIALLRVRGISASRIKYYYVLGLVIYVLAGSAVGLPLGPLIAKMLYPGAPIVFQQLLSTLLDPFAIIGILAFIIILMAASIRKSFKVITGVSPIEYTHPTIMTQLPLLKRGITKGTILLLVLSIYYLLRIFEVLDPYRLMQSTNINPLLGIAVIFMIVLEPIMVFFGQVILIYTVAKLLISYPDLLSRMIGWIGGHFTKEFKRLIGRFTLVKPARISLSIIIGSFALSILLFGLLGAASSTIVFERLDETATGGVDYVVYKYVIIPHNTSLSRIVEQEARNITSAINGSYTYMLAYKGELGVTGYRYVSVPFYEPGKPNVFSMVFKFTDGTDIIPEYMLFVPENFTRIVNFPRELALSGNYESGIRDLESGSTDTVFLVKGWGYGYSSQLPGEVSIKAYVDSNESVIGRARTVYLRNMPAPLAIYKSLGYMICDFESSSVSYGPGSSIDIVVPRPPGAILPLSFYEEFAKRLPEDSSAAFFIVYFVKGSVDSYKLGPGTHVADIGPVRESIRSSAGFFRMSFDTNIATGISLFIISMLVMGLLSYTIIYENLYTYTLLRGRGVSSRTIYMLAVAEAVSIGLFAVIPGIVLGVVLAYGIPVISLLRTGVTRFTVEDVYGLRFSLVLTPISIVYLIAIPLVILIVSWIVIHLMYRRVAREAIQVIGSHI